MKVLVAQINAFTDNGRGGNPAGVVRNADHLSHDQKLAIARAANLSETAFVSRSEVADLKLEFFTPTRQIAHCGHATIATFSYLAQQGYLSAGEYTKETIDGTRRIWLRDNQAFMEQRAPTFTPLHDLQQAVLDSLNLDVDQLLAQPMRVDTGNGFLVLGLQTRQQLAALQPKLPAIEALSETLDLVGYYLFTTDAVQAGRQASTRMFAPRFGIAEEAATGMAAGPLACYLAREMGYPKAEFFIEQGHFMAPASPSVIQVQLSRTAGAIGSLVAGGSARFVKEIALDL